VAATPYSTRSKASNKFKNEKNSHWKEKVRPTKRTSTVNMSDAREEIPAKKGKGPRKELQGDPLTCGKTTNLLAAPPKASLRGGKKKIATKSQYYLGKILD